MCVCVCICTCECLCVSALQYYLLKGVEGTYIVHVHMSCTRNCTFGKEVLLIDLLCSPQKELRY